MPCYIKYIRSEHLFGIKMIDETLSVEWMLAAVYKLNML